MYTLYRGTESVHCLVLVIIPLDDVEKTAFAFSYSGLLVVLCVCMSLMYTSKVHSTLPFEIYSTVCIYLSKKKKEKKKPLSTPLLPFFLSFLYLFNETMQRPLLPSRRLFLSFLFFFFSLSCAFFFSSFLHSLQLGFHILFILFPFF